LVANPKGIETAAPAAADRRKNSRLLDFIEDSSLVQALPEGLFTCSPELARRQVGASYFS
jgi:hypothetical protein